MVIQQDPSRLFVVDPGRIKIGRFLLFGSRSQGLPSRKNKPHFDNPPMNGLNRGERLKVISMKQKPSLG